MPYYRITLTYNDGSTVKIIRQHKAFDIEFVGRYFTEQLKKNYTGKTINALEVVMVSKQCPEVKDYINAQVRKGYGT